MPSVPWEVEIDILSCLPVKSLIRFRCVCKNWLALLTKDPHFIDLHLNRTIQLKKQNPNILLSEVGSGRKTTIYSGSDFDQVTELQSPIKRSHELLGCSNGILCFKHSRSDDGMYVWNPATGEHCAIPACPVYDKIAYFGFGYHEDTNQYKVIKVAGAPDSDAYVYTLGTTSWRCLGNFPYCTIPRNGIEQSSTLVNGALHWVLYQVSYQPYAFDKVIVSFDLKKELFGVISLPSYYCHYVGDLGGLLCSTGFLMLKFNIWVMKEYGVVSSWTNLSTLEQSIGRGPVDKIRLVGIRKNGELIVCKTGQTLLFYNLEGELIKETESSVSENCRACNYIGSLLSPRVIAGLE